MLVKEHKGVTDSAIARQPASQWKPTAKGAIRDPGREQLTRELTVVLKEL